MAITIRSHGTSPGTDTTSVVITKPTGLTVGDLMIAQVYGYDKNGTVGTFTGPVGWTLIAQRTVGDEDSASALFWKNAEAADVAASNFTFTATNTQSSRGAITAMYGHNSSDPINVTTGIATGTSASWTVPTITPTVANCMLLMFAGYEDDATISGWGITTDNPAAWTEQYDLPSNLTDDIGLAMAWALRPETSATDGGYATISGPNTNTGQIVAIEPTPPERRIFITHQ